MRIILLRRGTKFCIKAFFRSRRVAIVLLLAYHRYAVIKICSLILFLCLVLCFLAIFHVLWYEHNYFRIISVRKIEQLKYNVGTKMTRQWLLNAFVLNTTMLMDPVSLVRARRSGDNLLSRDQNALSF